MLTQFTTPFVEAKDEYMTWIQTQEYPSYEELLKRAIELINDRAEFGYAEEMDPERIHVIDDGNYQGTILIVIGATGYQPSTYWSTSVNYGSCSGCDALQDAWGYADDHNMEAVYLIALHMVQGLRPIE